MKKKTIPQQGLFDNESKQYLEEARKIAMQIAYEEGSVSADDVREKYPTVECLSRNAIGALFKTKDFIWSGVKKSKTPSRKGGMISTYLLADDARAFIQQQYQRKAELCLR